MNKNSSLNIKKIMDHSITAITGIGPATSAKLENEGIKTVGQLSEVNPENIKITNIRSLITKAKKYLQDFDKQQQEKASIEAIAKRYGVTGATNSTKKENTPHNIPDLTAIAPGITLDKTKPPEPEECKYFISDHSWYEFKIQIPKLENNNNSSSSDQNSYALRDAVIYDLSVEPHSRISLVCAWITQDADGEKRCSMTYSPQFLLFFNMNLPKLEISVRPEDWTSLPNQNTLENVVKEVNMMVKFVTDTNL